MIDRRSMFQNVQQMAHIEQIMKQPIAQPQPTVQSTTETTIETIPTESVIVETVQPVIESVPIIETLPITGSNVVNQPKIIKK